MSESWEEFKADGTKDNALVSLTTDNGWYSAGLTMGGANPNVVATRKNKPIHRVERDISDIAKYWNFQGKMKAAPADGRSR